MAKSPKAIFWLLFAAGGTVTSFVLPVMVFVTGLAPAAGLFEGALSFATMSAFVGNWLVKLIVFGVIFLALWHAAHRLRVLAHDFGLRSDGAVAVVVYVGAAIGSIAAIIALLGV